jgi:NADPH-dependent curcumin reductase CurA
VSASRNDDFAEGDIVTGMLGWEQYSLSDGSGLRKVPTGPAPLSYHLGILGMPGLTAYVGLHHIGKAQAGETVFVSAASGAVGSVVGQLAHLHGCTVAGCAGADDKVDLLKTEFAYDAAFNYRNSRSLSDSVKEVCPDGVDVDFENVGGEIFEAVLWNMRLFGRIALCGMIANYNDETLQPGPRGMISIVGKRLTIQGFIVMDHMDVSKEYITKATQWIAEGKLKYHETIADGIENAPTAFIDLLQGKNIGKQVVRLADL